MKYAMQIALSTFLAFSCASPISSPEDREETTTDDAATPQFQINGGAFYLGQITGEHAFKKARYDRTDADSFTIDLGTWEEDSDRQIYIDGEFHQAMECAYVDTDPRPGTSPDYPSGESGKLVGVPEKGSLCGLWLIKQPINGQYRRVGVGWLHDISVNSDSTKITFDGHNTGTGDGPAILHGEWTFQGIAILHEDDGTHGVKGNWSMTMSETRRSNLERQVEEGSLSQEEFEREVEDFPEGEGEFTVWVP